ncbi:gasdermin-A3-like [Narcine bancroftii]|uniref:gasdermin-A3-like n=1 Tax=Narcine bancroftii TaxID=1343680 RepID=UPI00383118FF
MAKKNEELKDRMFKKAVQQLINQIDCGGELIPVASVYDSEKFKPLCLVCRRSDGPFWRKAKYSCTEFKLQQILVDELNLPTAQQNDLSFQLSKSLERPMKGMAMLRIDPLVGNIEISNKVSEVIQLEGTKQIYISVPDLTKSLEHRKVGRSWELIRKSYPGDLCVVTEALMSMQPITLKEDNNSRSELYVTLPSTSSMGAEYNLLTEKAVFIPKGAVLAYKVWDLTVTKDDILYLSMPKKKTWPKSWMCLDSADVNGEEGFGVCCELQCLDKGLRQNLLGLVCKIIEDSELHSILSDVLSNACAGIDYKLSELDKLEENRREYAKNLLAFWSEDQLKNAIEHKLLKAMSFLLTALEDLPPATLQLLIQSLKMQILPQQLRLVTVILKELEHTKADSVLKVETKGLTEDAFGITAEMLNEIGLHLERESVQKMKEPSLHELSIALFCLNALSSQ